MNKLLTMKQTIASEKRFNEYRKFVKFLADNKINYRFPNASSKHAAVVLSNILNTSDNVYIYDDNLKGDIAYQHPDFMNSLSNFCSNKNKRITFVIKPFSDFSEQKLLMHIKRMKEVSKPKAQIKIYTYSNEFVQNVQDITNNLFEYKGNINFTIGDNSYRIEKFPDIERYEAECNLYAPDVVKQLQVAFNEDILETCYYLNL